MGTFKKGRLMNEFNNGLLTGMSVLIVDDTPANINILGHIMARGDLNVSVALMERKL